MRWVVVGTGTNVGKTEVSCAILRAARRAGLEPRGLKPVITGTSEVGLSDSDRLGHAAGSSVASLYDWPQPVSPHLAARWAGQSISIQAIREWVSASSANATLVETAGGLFSPLSDLLTNLDLVKALQPARTVLVCPARLGVLHDLTACLHALGAELSSINPVIVAFGLASPLETARQSEEIRRVVLPRFPRQIELVTLEASPDWLAEDNLLRAVS